MPSESRDAPAADAEERWSARCTLDSLAVSSDNCVTLRQRRLGLAVEERYDGDRHSAPEGTLQIAMRPLRQSAEVGMTIARSQDQQAFIARERHIDTSERVAELAIERGRDARDRTELLDHRAILLVGDARRFVRRRSQHRAEQLARARVETELRLHRVKEALR